EQRKVYEIVKEAQKRAFDRIHPGAVCRDVDAAARKYIYDCGYQGCFSHGLGHSVGVEVHENPRFNENCTDILTEGIVITVEPGIYLKGRFGVRIEDMIVIRKDGFENLTASSKDLIIL
ncbi:MAG: M24 family metallopeptidase, partial [Lachnospiraceae bacterium]|nr:M24 family metallopeptidase [Lachnospiraceae bacterium]